MARRDGAWLGSEPHVPGRAPWARSSPSPGRAAASLGVHGATSPHPLPGTRRVLGWMPVLRHVVPWLAEPQAPLWLAGPFPLL